MAEAEPHRTWLNSEAVRGRCRFRRKCNASIVAIKINLCDAANLCSFAFSIALLASSAHRVVQVVFSKVGAPLPFKTLHQRVKGLRAHVWYIESFSRFVFYQPIRFVHQVGLRQVRKVLPNILFKIKKQRSRFMINDFTFLKKPNINMPIPLTGFHTFLKVLVGRIYEVMNYSW